MARSGVSTLMLNAVIGLVLVGVTFSTAFFLYSSFTRSLTESQVTRGFQKFVEPIEKVCQGEQAYVGSEMNLPLNPSYTYGIIQTRVVEDDPYLPFPMRKCMDGNCVCLIRIKKPEKPYEIWDPTMDSGWSDWITGKLGFKSAPYEGSPAPLWHFNTAGFKMFPSLVSRIVSFQIFKLFQYIGYHVLKKIITSLVCKVILSFSGPAVATCEAVLYAALTVGTEAAIAATNQFLEEVTEPFLFINYPNNVMTVPINPVGDDALSDKAASFIGWTAPSSVRDDITPLTEDDCITIQGTDYCCVNDGDCSEFETLVGINSGGCCPDCCSDSTNRCNEQGDYLSKAVLKQGSFYLDDDFGGGDYYEAAMAVARLSENDKEAIKKAAQVGAIKGAHKFASKMFGSIAAMGFAVSKFETKMNIRKEIGIIATTEPLPEQIRPLANVRSLLGVRRTMLLDEFIGSLSFSNVVKNIFDEIFHRDKLDVKVEPPGYDYYFDEGIRNYTNMDVINCVAINELGPLCDKDTKLLVDYGSDLLLSYQVTDPINFPEKAIFCGFNSGENEEYGYDIVQKILGPIDQWLHEKAPDKIANAITHIFGWLAKVIGDWFLGGVQSAKGMLMECVKPVLNEAYKSEYFQAWIAYPDTTGYGTSGSIDQMMATLTPDYGFDETINCQQAVVQDWANCACGFIEAVNNLDNKGDLENFYNGFVDDYTEQFGDDAEIPTLSELITTMDVYAAVNLKCSNGGAIIPSNSDKATLNRDLRNYINILHSFNKDGLNSIGGIILPSCSYDTQNDVCEYSDNAGTLLYSDSMTTCMDLFEPKYFRCIPGVHLVMAGVVQ